MAGPGTESEPMDLDSDDIISLTSTIEEEIDSEREWSVESVQAEAEIDGETKYLISWVGYPLWESSWEPKENLSEGLLADWENAKKKPEFKKWSNQNIAAWRKASIERFNAQLKRHRFRNCERAKQGLEQTTSSEERWAASIEYLNMHPTGEEDSEEEADDASIRPSQLPSTPSTSSPQPEIPATLPPGTPSSPTTQTTPPISRRSSDDGEGSLASGKAPAYRIPKKANSMPTPASTRPGVVRRQSATGTTASVTSAEQPKTAMKSGPASKLNANKVFRRTNSEPGRSQPAVRQANASEIGNVFSGGTMRKQKRTLLDAAVDPEVAPRQVRYRYQRLMEKAARDREGMVAPAKKPTELLCLDPEAQHRATQQNTTQEETIQKVAVQKGVVQKDTAQKDKNQKDATTPVFRPPTPPRKHLPEADATKEVSPDDPESGCGPPFGEVEEPSREEFLTESGDKELTRDNKKTNRKSVSFAATPLVHTSPVYTSMVQEPMEMNNEESLFFDNPPAPEGPAFKVEKLETKTQEQGNKASEMAPGFLKSAIKKASIDDYQRRLSTQDITKNARIGPDAPKLLSLKFSGLPRKDVQSWVSLFEDEEVLDFTHTCTAKDFFSMIGPFLSRSEHLCNGFVTWSDDPDELEVVADRLRHTSRAIFCHKPEYCILIHPSKCDDWVSEEETSLMLSAASPLSYRILQLNIICNSSWLAPLPNPLKASDQDPPPGVGPLVFHRLFRLDYNRLIPSPLQDTTKHPFFLAFPYSAIRDAHFLSGWLRRCNPECKLLTSIQPGHWFSFVRMKHGVVIIDEDAIWSIRLFPGFCNVLHESKGKISFWLFTKSLRASRQFASDTDSLASIGDITLRPIFGPGVAILMTPSLFVSQPQQSYRIVKWFWQNYVSNKGIYRLGRLILCAGIEDWLLELIMEKSEKPKFQEKITPAEYQRRKDDTQDRIKTMELIREIVTNGPNEAITPVVLAPETIDGNDEQSLVNWFGWWSIMNMNHFRKFTVVGSSEADPKRMWRRIKFPKYLKSVIGNPDDMYRRVDREGQPGHPQPENPPGSAPLAPKHHLDFQFIDNDHGITLKNYLFDRASRCKKTPGLPMILYAIPVSYWNPDMKFHFRDYTSPFTSYGNCFNWLGPFEAGRSANTMTSFFYTIEGRWDAAAYPQDITPTRRPWISVFRPCNVHKKPWRSTELLIWDLTSKGKSQDKDVYEEELIEAQREWIRLVAEENKLKNPSMPLARVWLGGSSTEPTDFTEALDVTLQHLDWMIGDFKYWVPAPEDKMPDRGWRLVKPGKSPSSPVGEPMDVDVQEEDDDPNMKLIFHPPRRAGPPGKTLCMNRLFEQTKKISQRGMDDMSYNFLPTLDWYGRQLAEGRGFEHIKVVTWETFISELKIPDPKKAGSEASK